MQTATITQKGQVTVPVSIRKKWNIKPFEKISFIDTGETVTIQPAKDFYSLKGSIKTPKKYSDRLSDQSIAQSISQEHDRQTNTH